MFTKIKKILIVTIISLNSYATGCIQEKLDGDGISTIDYLDNDGSGVLTKNLLKLPHLESLVVKSIVKLLEDNTQEELLSKKSKLLIRLGYIYKNNKCTVSFYLSDDKKIMNVKNESFAKGLIEEWLKIKEYQGRPPLKPLPMIE